MFFDTGSWWVHEELNSGIIDSQYVTNSEFVYSESDKNKKNTQYWKSQTAVVQINKGFYFRLASLKGSGVIEKIRNIGTEAGRTDLVFKKLYVGAYLPGGSTKIIAIDNNYTLNNDTNVLITLFDRKDESESGDSMEYKVFKGVGIINKKNITKKENWQLINYHINLNKQ